MPEDYLQLRLAESKWAYRIPLVTWPVMLLEPLSKLLGRNAVDLGTNIGSFCLVYGEIFSSITAVDASSECLAAAQENLRGRKNVHFIHGALAQKSGESIELRRVYFGNKFEPGDFTSISWDENELESSNSMWRPGDVEEVCQSISWEDVVQVAGGGS